MYLSVAEVSHNIEFLQVSREETFWVIDWLTVTEWLTASQNSDRKHRLNKTTNQPPNWYNYSNVVITYSLEQVY